MSTKNNGKNDLYICFDDIDLYELLDKRWDETTKAYVRMNTAIELAKWLGAMNSIEFPSRSKIGKLAKELNLAVLEWIRKENPYAIYEIQEAYCKQLRWCYKRTGNTARLWRRVIEHWLDVDYGDGDKKRGSAEGVSARADPLARPSSTAQKKHKKGSTPLQ